MYRRLCLLTIALTLFTGVIWTNSVLAAENRGRAVPLSALPNDLKKVTIRDYFVPGTTREAGVIQTVIANVVVARGDLSQAYYAANGDKLYEKDIIFTLRASKCRVKLHNEDIITLGDNARLAVREVAGNKGTTEKTSTMSLARGKAMFYAIRLLKHKELNMKVESPTAVAGVRGTKFGMDVAVENDKEVGALPLQLADTSGNWGRHLLLAQAGTPAGITTNVHGFDGTVVVTSTFGDQSRSVGPGETLVITSQGLGPFMPTPPNVSQQFQSQTNVPPPGGTSGQPSGAAGTGVTDGTGQALGALGPRPLSSTGPTPTIFPQDVNPPTPSPPPNPPPNPEPVDPKTNASGAKVGYFASLLTNATNQKLAEVFISQNRYSGEGNVWARGLTTDSNYIRAYGQSSGSPYLKYVNLNAKGTGDLGTANPISKTVIDSNAVSEWGYASVSNPFTIDGISYGIDNRTYWIFGTNTPSLQGFTGTAVYSGSAYGTYWSSGGGVNMTGNVHFNVNFGTGDISGFNLSVSGRAIDSVAGRTPASFMTSASITGASGKISSDATFSVTGGTWDLNGTTPDKYAANGSFYGATAGSVGGVWSMANSTQNTGAAGIFQGDKVPYVAVQKGFLVGMAEYRINGGAVQYADAYMTQTIFDFTTFPVTARTSTNNGSFILDGSNGEPVLMTRLITPDGSWTAASASEKKPVIFNTMGYNDYLEWGTWIQPADMAITKDGVTKYYAFNSTGWYVKGDPTTDDQMASLKQGAITASYSGTSAGTFYAASSTPTALAGTFSADVAFAAASNQITNFAVNMSGSGNAVAIANGVGSFNSITAGKNSEFTLDPTVGTYTLTTNNVTTNATTKIVNGSVFGSQAQVMGGKLTLGDGTNCATGMFQGTKLK